MQYIDLTFMGLCILRIFLHISNKMQRYTVYFVWKLLYMFRVVLSGGTIHHQERKQLYLQHLVFVTPLVLPAATAAGSTNGVEQFPDKINCVTLHLVGYTCILEFNIHGSVHRSTNQ
jgi:hypothetical protein